MKASHTALSALSALSMCFVVAGCGVFSDGPDAEQQPAPTETDAPTRPAEDDKPAAPPLQGTPTTSDLDESLGVFVVSTAASGGDGTRAHPFATLAEGIAAAQKVGKRVYACEGTYKESVTIAGGISMVGGLDCSIATWKVGTGRSRIESPTSPALSSSSVSVATRFTGFEVIAPDATEPGGSSIALFATASSLLTIDNVRLVAGNGANGSHGVEGVQASNGPNADGKAGPPAGPFCPAVGPCFDIKNPIEGGAGGTSACGGGAGGTGGTGGLWQPVDASSPSSGWNYYRLDNAYAPRSGTTTSGSISNGADGASANTPGQFTKEGFVASNGTKGSNGSPGVGGRGGQGAGPTVSGFGKGVWYGIQGSGGGAGGCGGVAGTEGKGGGASVAAFIVDGAVSFVESELVAQNGGAGGNGTFGAAPTDGGKGGPEITGAIGSFGLFGKPGGLAGISGSGAGGSSVALVFFGPKPSTDAKTKLVVGSAGKGVAELTNGVKTIPASAPGVAVETAGGN